MNTLNYLHLDEKRVADVVTALHLLLADFQIHYTNLRGFHWDIKGHGFFVLHSKFEDLYNDTAEKIDEIAERILYNPQIQISAESGTKRSIFRQKNKTKRSKKRLHTTLIKPEQKVNEDLCSGFILS